MIDDELVITVRVRIPRELSKGAQVGYAWKASQACTEALDDIAPAALAGVEVALPTFDQIPTTGASP
jgi:hypothetical protein